MGIEDCSLIINFLRLQRYLAYNVKKLNENPENFTAKDVLNFWEETYSQIRKKRYNRNTFIGFELSQFKTLLLNYSVYDVLLAIISYLHDNGYSIKHFVENFSNYQTNTKYSKLIYWIKKGRNEQYRKDLDILLALESKWFPNGGDTQRQKQLEQKLKQNLGLD